MARHLISVNLRQNILLGKSIVCISENTIVGKALRLPLNWIPNGSPVRILQGSLRGKKWIAGAAIHRCWLGLYEWHMQQAFLDMARPGGVVFDIGANVGFYSLLASSLVGPTGRVFSFEPLPRNLTYLRKHLSLNEVLNCEVFPLAIANETAILDFSVSGPCTSKLYDAGPSTIRVQATTIDELVSSGRLPAPDLIKCDIEGAEYEALCGARKTLSAKRPTIILATHGAHVLDQCSGLLHALRYNLKPLAAGLEEPTEFIAEPQA